MNGFAIRYLRCEKDKADPNPIKKQRNPKILLTLSYKRILNSKDNRNP